MMPKFMDNLLLNMIPARGLEARLVGATTALATPLFPIIGLNQLLFRFATPEPGDKIAASLIAAGTDDAHASDGSRQPPASCVFDGSSSYVDLAPSLFQPSGTNRHQKA